MARKSLYQLMSQQKKASDDSWAALGIDASMSSMAFTGVGYDAMHSKMTHASFRVVHWTSDHHYFDRLEQAARAHDLVLEVCQEFWVLDPASTYLAIEEPFPMGAAKQRIGGWMKQQAEINGALKGSLLRYGYRNIFEINNSQWKKVLREDGVEFISARGLGSSEKKKTQLANKLRVKKWAMGAYGLPDLPDLVAGKGGGKIPRPESGHGAKAQAVQPSDVYDAAACMAWMQNEIERGVANG